MTRNRLVATVIDDATGETIEAVPTRILCVEAAKAYPAAVWARHYEGEMVHCDPRDLAWHKSRGHEPRLVRIEGWL